MSRARILVVDDQEDNFLLLADLLSADYELHQARTGQDALGILAAGTLVDLILLDIVMPGMDGYETCARLKASPATQDIPILFISGLSSDVDEERGLDLGAEDFIHKPFSGPVVAARVRNHLQLAMARGSLKDRNAELERMVAERTREIMHQSALVQASQAATITAFCALAEARDNETGNHIRRTQHYIQALAGQLRQHPRFREVLDEQTIVLLFRSAPLHDIGKVAIPDFVLNKPGKLSSDEWKIMQRHTEYGRDAIAQAERDLADNADNFLRLAREIAYGHHERWDGSGYPQGLSGEEIPVSARLMAVADVYDALISKRVYKPAYSHEAAIEIMKGERGKHFDPAILDAMLTIAEEFREIARSFRDAEDLTPGERVFNL